MDYLGPGQVDEFLVVEIKFKFQFGLEQFKLWFVNEQTRMVKFQSTMLFYCFLS